MDVIHVEEIKRRAYMSRGGKHQYTVRSTRGRVLVPRTFRIVCDDAHARVSSPKQEGSVCMTALTIY